MKKMFFGCALLACCLAMPVVFADDCCYSPQYDPCCGVDFDGFYVGGNFGAFSHIAHRNDRDGFLTDNSGVSAIDTSFTAGVLLGFDWQCGNRLFGLVADWNWVNTRIRHRDNPNAPDDNFIHSDFDWFTTIRARAGLAVCDALVYLTGGAAVARFETTWGNPPVNFHHNHTRWGWTAGVGTELMLTCNWSIGAEVLFLHFSERTRSFTTDATTFEFGHSDSAFVGRILLNYRFGDLFCCN